MGIYLGSELSSKDRVKMMLLNGTKFDYERASQKEIEEHLKTDVLVCMTQGDFVALAVMYNKQELNRWVPLNDGRIKTWWLLPKEFVFKQLPYLKEFYKF